MVGADGTAQMAAVTTPQRLTWMPSRCDATSSSLSPSRSTISHLQETSEARRVGVLACRDTGTRRDTGVPKCPLFFELKKKKINGDTQGTR